MIRLVHRELIGVLFEIHVLPLVDKWVLHNFVDVYFVSDARRRL
jgi:hypothetical protein